MDIGQTEERRRRRRAKQTHYRIQICVHRIGQKETSMMKSTAASTSHHLTKYAASNVGVCKTYPRDVCPLLLRWYYSRFHLASYVACQTYIWVCVISILSLFLKTSTNQSPSKSREQRVLRAGRIVFNSSSQNPPKFSLFLSLAICSFFTIQSKVSPQRIAPLFCPPISSPATHKMRHTHTLAV